MAGADEQFQGFVQESFGGDPGRDPVCRQGAEGRVDHPFEHRLCGLCGVLLVQRDRVQVRLGAGAVEPVDGLGGGDAPIEDIDAQRAASGVDGPLGLLDGGQDLLGVRQEDLPVQAQPGTSGTSHHERDRDMPLQGRDPLGDRLLADSQLVGGGLELADPGDDHERPQRFHIHAISLLPQLRVVSDAVRVV